MCVLYVNFGFKVRHITFGCVVMGNAMLFMFLSRLLLYSAGSGVNRVQIVLSGFSVRFVLFCPDKNCMQVWLYVFLVCTRAYVWTCDGDVICACHDLNWCYW